MLQPWRLTLKNSKVLPLIMVIVYDPKIYDSVNKVFLSSDMTLTFDFKKQYDKDQF
jgi:hypothetical protein